MCVVVLACNAKRDSQLKALYLDGTTYLRQTRADLEKTNTADAAAEVIEKSLPRLEALVERKKKLEKEYREIRNQTERLKLHAQFEEFQQMRLELLALMDYGKTLHEKYQAHKRFINAVQRGWTLLHYF